MKGSFLRFQISNEIVSRDMAEVRARVALKVGAKSDIDAEILSFHGFRE